MSIEQLELAASVLGGLRDRVVFVGGATIGLWLTDPASRAPRVTYDVDVIAEVATLAAYCEFQERLRRRGFHEDIASGVICRWIHTDTNLVLDAVPSRTRLAGFGGRWLARAARAGSVCQLPSGETISAVPPPWLLITKLEAFASRGGRDCLASRDFEDIALLIDARAELGAELAALPGEASRYAARELRRIVALPTFDYGLEGALVGSDARARATAVTGPRFHRLAEARPS